MLARYRRNAEKCLELAQSFNDPEAKRALLVMANAWLILAARREKKIAPPNEPSPAPPRDEPPKQGDQPPPLHLNSAEPDDPKLES